MHRKNMKAIDDCNQLVYNIIETDNHNQMMSINKWKKYILIDILY